MEIGITGGSIALMILFAIPLTSACTIGWLYKKIKKQNDLNYKITGITFWLIFLLEMIYVFS